MNNYNSIQKYFIAIMRITLLQALFLPILAVCANAFDLKGQEILNKELSLNVENREIKKVLVEIEKKTGVRFTYSSSIIKLDRKVTIQSNSLKLSAILDLIFSPDITYEVNGKQIVLIPMHDDASINDLNNVIESEKKLIKITGSIKDDAGQPLPGVNVIEKGTTNGLTSDADGLYVISVTDGNSVLVFSFIGFQAQEVFVGNQTVVDISMKPDIKVLSEVVVVGYGVQKKSDLTGSVTQVSNKDLGLRTTSSLGNLLQGRVAGLDVTGDEIRIRGTTTLNNTTPLIIVDGVQGGNLSTINPNNIESISVLKDASATAIYGANGASGVIIITTKTGKAGSSKINYYGYTGFENVAKKLDLLNPQQYIDYVSDLQASRGQTLSPKLASPDALIQRTDWQDAVTKTGLRNEHNLDFSGGSKESTYFVGLGYNKTTDYIIGPKDESFYININNTYNVNKFIKLGTKVLGKYSKGTGQARPYSLISAFLMPSYAPIFDANNSWGYFNVDRSSDLTDTFNPVVQTALSKRNQESLDYQATGFIEVKPIEGLTFRSQITVSGNFYFNQSYSSQYQNGGINQLQQAQLIKTAGRSFRPLVENFITYIREFRKHSFSVLVGNNYIERSYNDEISVTGKNFIDENNITIANAGTAIANADQVGQNSLVSYFGRLNYSYDDRYLLTATLRRDGSPNFGASNRFGTFPSVALGWNIHNEKFMKDVEAISQLKIRGSYGEAGNSNFAQYQYVSRITSRPYYVFGDNAYKGASVISPSNPNIKWETTYSTNIAVDLGLFQNKLNLTVEYYNKDTRDILFQVPQPNSTGFGENKQGGSPFVNAASVVNNGFEFLVNYRENIGKFNVDVTGTLTTINNQVTSLGSNGEPFLDANGFSRTDKGNPIGYFYGYKVDHIYKNQAEVDADNQAAKAAGYSYYQVASTAPGDIKFKDINGDGVINSKDRTNIGAPIPKFTYGLNTTISYGNFSMNAVFTGVYGGKLYNNLYDLTREESKIRNQETWVLDRWRNSDNPGNGKVPRAVFGDAPGNGRVSDLNIESGSYLRLSQFSLSYSLSDKLLQKMLKGTFSNLRVFSTITNLFTITDFTGLNPVVGGNNLARGIGGSDFNTRTVSLGLQFGL